MNLTRLNQIPTFIDLYNERKIDFIEILLDNFWDLDPKFIFSDIQKIPVSFHIMNSNYIEREKYDLQKLSEKILLFTNFFNPMYISDHIFQTKVNNIHYPTQIECDYKNNYDLIISKINLWQDLLNTNINIENFPSFFDKDKEQIYFFENAKKHDGINMLFDFSNALISSYNNDYAPEQWSVLIQENKHFHVSGYRKLSGTKKLMVDTHDVRISKETQSFIQSFKSYLSSQEATIVIEYDKQISMEEWIEDINNLRTLLI